MPACLYIHKKYVDIIYNFGFQKDYDYSIQPRKLSRTGSTIMQKMLLSDRRIIRSRLQVCSGSIVVTTLDYKSGGSWFESRVGANIL